MNRLLTTCFKITRTDDQGGKLTAYVHADRDEDGVLRDVRVTPKAKTGSAFEDLMQKVSDRIGKEIRRKA